MDRMCSFLALYHGATPGEAQLISVSTDPVLVRKAALQMLDSAQHSPGIPRDKVTDAYIAGRKRALQLIITGVNTQK